MDLVPVSVVALFDPFEDIGGKCIRSNVDHAN